MTVTQSFEAPDANYSARVNGPLYVRFLRNFHAVMAPKTYLEIGTQTGTTLAVANCASIAVDPRFLITDDVIQSKPACLLFQKTSDDFFREHDPTALLGAPLDFVFLDGLHKFEYLLRDFINTERHTHKHSAILMHDCVPPGFYMTTRKRNDPIRLQKSAFGEWWTGDVFKVVPVLQRYRPDLTIHVLDNAPTGLIMITGLDAQNNVLGEAYDKIVENTCLELDRDAYEAYWKDLHVEKSADFMGKKQLMQAVSR